jgi:hypothetical protein
MLAEARRVDWALGWQGTRHLRDPPDEDDRRDLIADDYQLQLDVDTFEQLTGKVIQPGDDEPTLGDEIELEDIERSL